MADIAVTNWEVVSPSGIKQRRIGAYLLQAGPNHDQTYGFRLYDNGTLLQERPGFPTLEVAQLVAETVVVTMCNVGIEMQTLIRDTIISGNPDVGALIHELPRLKEASQEHQ